MAVIAGCEVGAGVGVGAGEEVRVAAGAGVGAGNVRPSRTAHIAARSIWGVLSGELFGIAFSNHDDKLMHFFTP